MTPEQQREVASRGGKNAHAKGTAHKFTSEEAAKAGLKGGAAISANKEHMRQIGRKGGTKVAADREHMAELGRRGIESKRRRNAASQEPQT